MNNIFNISLLGAEGTTTTLLEEGLGLWPFVYYDDF